MKHKKLAFTTFAIGAGLATYLIKNRANKTIISQAITNFNIEKYLGLWYEIARLDNFWEKHQNNVTARYLKYDDQSIEVINRSYNQKKKIWNRSKGIAKLIKADVGRFKISFLEPIYSSYNIIDIDDDYNYALVAGKNTNFLWILSRNKFITNEIKERFITKAKQLGFATDKLIWTTHNDQ